MNLTALCAFCPWVASHPPNQAPLEEVVQTLTARLREHGKEHHPDIPESAWRVGVIIGRLESREPNLQ